MDEMVDCQVEDYIEEHKAEKEVWRMMDKWKSTKMERVHSGWDGNKSKMHLSFRIGMDEVFEFSFDL